MRLAVALFLAAAVAAALAPAPAGAQPEQVTLRVERFWSEACNCHKYRFSGTIASSGANEYVAVLQQVCGQPFSTAITGASTRAGGFWEAESNGPVGTGTFRARWDNHLSDPVTYRAELSILLAQLGGGRVRVSVSSFGVKLKVVELQRL